jgi:hypothetical protein
MKALILGTDFLKDNNGNLRIIETNTNVDIHNKIVPDLDWTLFKQLLIDNSINTVHLISTIGNFLDVDRENPFDTVTPNISLKDKMSEVVNEINGTFNHHEVAKNSVTVPFIEDGNGILIIRTSYDTTAVVDEDYAKDKVNFHRLISEKPYTPNVYYHSESDTSLNVDQLTELHVTTGDTPNYIVKTRYPNTNYIDYPKFYKIESLGDLETLKSSLLDSEHMEEYHTNSENIVNEKMGVIRSLDILYGPTLSLLHMGSYLMTTPVKFNSWETTYDSSGKMEQKGRPLWMSKSPKSTIGPGYIMDDDTPILYPDGTFKQPNEILSNDFVKTIKLTWVPEDEVSEEGEPIYLTDVNSGTFSTDLTTFSTGNSEVIDFLGQTKESLMIKVTLENGITYEDLPGSSMMIEEYDTLETTFTYTNKFRLNDSIVFFDYINNTLVKSKIVDLEVVYVIRKVYEINVEHNDIFLPLADEALGLTFIQHNGACFGWCGTWTCATWYCSACNFCDPGGGPKSIT